MFKQSQKGRAGAASINFPELTAFFRNLRLGLNRWIPGHACILKAEHALIKTRDQGSETRGC